MALILPFRARKKLASSKTQMTANDFPACLWSEDLPGSEYKEYATTGSLFKGYVLERLSRYLFTVHRVSRQPLATGNVLYIHGSFNLFRRGLTRDTFLQCGTPRHNIS
jgi:hypothetical protein